MAAMIASRRAAPMAKLLEKLLVNPARALEASSQSAVRSFNTNAQMRGADEEERAHDVDRRGDDRISRRQGRVHVDYPISAGVFYPVNLSRGRSQVPNLMDQMRDAAVPASAQCIAGRDWDTEEDNDAFHIRFDMPGLDKEHVKMSVDKNILVIRGKGDKESGNEDAGIYIATFDLLEGPYKTDQIRAEMKNGVLKVTVPKVKGGKRKREDAMMNQMMDRLFRDSARGIADSASRDWGFKEEDDALYVRMYMPGLGMEHVKISREQDTLIIRGDHDQKYIFTVDVSGGVYKTDQIRAEMKDGLLKVTVPKVTEEEGSESFEERH